MKVFTLLSLGLLLLGSLATAQTPTPLAANGQLKVVNRQLTNQSGKAIQLRGMSTHGLQWFDQCYTQASIQALARDWGADILRAAMYVDEGGYLNNQAGLRAKIDQIVDWTGQAGIYCIIDWHVLNPGNPNERLSYAIDFFRTMAQKHAGKKNVIYEICNEPNGVDWNTIKAYADQVIPVIRQYDAQAIILCGTPQWDQRPQDVLANPLTGANAYNVMYTFHYYAASHFFQSDIKGVSTQLPLFCSEWGTSTYSGGGNLDFTNGQNWLDLMAGQNPGGQKISWCNWTFSDAGESSAGLNSGACNSQQWNNTSQSGTWVKDHILNPADDFGPPAAPTPSVAITSPASNTTLLPGASFVITAAVSNTVATSVEFYNGTAFLGSDATAPYTFTVQNATVGNYSYTAKALLSSGGPLTSLAVVVNVAPAPNQVPTVTLTNPVSNTTLTAPATITLTASANDSDGSVAKVEFVNGAAKLGESMSTPYRYVAANLGAGTYTLSAKATDNQGATATSGTVTVVVVEPGSSASDLIGPDCVSTNAVKTYSLNSNLLANATAYSWWCTGSTQQLTQAGSQVTINFGTSFTGGQVCVGVNYSVSPWYKQYCKDVTVCTGTPPVTPPANQAPTVSLTSPVNAATFTAPATINLTAQASDSDGSVAKVEFFNGSTKVGESTAAPFSISWSNVSANTYTLTAKATDNQGATTTSTAISIQVKAAPTTPPPTNPNADLIGPDCARLNDVVTFSLNARNLANATAQSWWCGGSTQSITPGSMGNATYNFGPNFTGGQVCVGINYSAAPWYHQFCKNVTVCAAGARVGTVEPGDMRVYPNPSTTQFTFVADGPIQGMTLADQLGREMGKMGPAKTGQTITFGSQLPVGTYLLHIQYEAQKHRAVKLLKVAD